jgi:hypothetical protein
MGLACRQPAGEVADRTLIPTVYDVAPDTATIVPTMAAAVASVAALAQGGSSTWQRLQHRSGLSEASAGAGPGRDIPSRARTETTSTAPSRTWAMARYI